MGVQGDMKIRIKREPATEEEWQKFKSLNVNLPKDYYEFMKTHNGGVLDNTENFVTTYSDAYGEFSVSRFFPLIEVFEEKEDVESCFPICLLKIGNDPFGNIFCIKVEGENVGEIYLWTPFDPPENEPIKGDLKTYEDIHLLSSSFTDFCDSLGPVKG